jgi:aspartate oxidase
MNMHILPIFYHKMTPFHPAPQVLITEGLGDGLQRKTGINMTLRAGHSTNRILKYKDLQQFTAEATVEMRDKLSYDLRIEAVFSRQESRTSQPSRN